MVSDEMIVLSGFGECWFIERSAIDRITTAFIPVLKFKLTYLKLNLYDERVIWAQMNYRLANELKSVGDRIGITACVGAKFKSTKVSMRLANRTI